MTRARSRRDPETPTRWGAARARRAFTILAVCGLAALAAPGGSEAAEPYTYTLILQGSLGGPLEESQGDAGQDNSGFQLGFAMVGKGDIQIGGRVGSIDFDDGLGGLADASLDYVHLGADYRFQEGFYDSGVYLGIGQYEVEGLGPGGVLLDESSIGLAVGVTGEFDLAKNFGLMLELTGHVTDLDAAELFVTGHAGIAIHF